MFKFFRQYNKLILVVGAAFLMVAFLIQPVLSMFMGSPGDRPIGSINGEQLTLTDQHTAASEIEILSQLHPVLGYSARAMAASDGSVDAEKWLLMVRDARRLGLSASESMTREILTALEVDRPQVNEAARRFGASDDFAYQAVRHWIMLQQYAALVSGQEHAPPTQIVQYADLYNQAMRSENQWMIFQVQMALGRGWIEGPPRLSEPLVQWYLSEQQATVSGEALLVSAERYLDSIETPDDSTLQELFEEHRDDLPGEGEPYGFGYKYPDRIQLEWLAFPIETLRDHVEVQYHEALEYYQQHPEEFRAEEDEEDEEETEADGEEGDDAQDAPDLQPFNDVRDGIIDQLRDEKAEQLARQMVSAAQSELFSELRRLSERGGYRQIPDDFEPTPFETIADTLEEQFGVRPRIERRVDQWLPADQWSELEGLGESHVQDRPQARFAAYVQSARELEPAEDNTLTTMRLQVQVPSRPMQGTDGSRYLFRLTDVQPTHAPDSLEEVREQVVADARRSAAYDTLTEQQDQWTQRAIEEGFDTLAEQPHVTRQPIDAIPRRRMGMGGELTVPSIPGIGSHAELVDALFETAQRVTDRGRESVDAAPGAERIGAVAVDPALSLVVYRLDDYQPLTRSQLEQLAESPQIEGGINSLLLGEAGGAALSKEAVARRVGFERAESGVPADDGQPQPPQRRPGSL
ncbi:MAG: hypothetical protein ACODAQ_08330 [Phycisphaeraceae bacterium]